MMLFIDHKKIRKLIYAVEHRPKSAALLILGLLTFFLAGCDFLDQLANLGTSVGDMVGKGVGGG